MASNTTRGGIVKRFSVLYFLSPFVAVMPAFGQQQLAQLELEQVTVTATRVERPTQQVPESIAVIGQERIDSSRMFNIADAIAGTPGVNITSKNGGYSTRVIIRGGGLKANYGIRELFFMRDGVPLTDPDSFTKLDLLNTQDIERIEITKGPGNIYATGSTAGVIHVISRSVFEDTANSVTVGAGDEDQANFHARISEINGPHAYAVTASYRQDNNDWRRWNEFESSQFSFKYGYQLDDGSELTAELSFTDADLDLPGDMNESQFQEFRHSGRQTDNNSVFKHGGRYSDTWAFNIAYQTEITDALSYRPRAYYTNWSHYHPVTPMISDSGTVEVIGTDQEILWYNSYGTLVSGITLRAELAPDGRRYEYGDVNTELVVPGFGAPYDAITSTRSNQRGQLAETSDDSNTVYGLFAQQSIDYFENWIIDLTARYDQVTIEQDIEMFREYNWGKSIYQDVAPADAKLDIDETFDLLATRIGASYRLNDEVNIYVNIARGEQVPFASELESNPDLDASETQSYELGLKGTVGALEFDAAVYRMDVDDEHTATLDQNNETVFQNAGETRKYGFELASRLALLDDSESHQLWGGLNYTYSDYEFRDFEESYVQYGMGPPTQVTLDNAGNQLPFIPEHFYSVSLQYAHPVGIRARLQSDTWDEYYIDNANSEKYDGYEWLTSFNISYQFLPRHRLSVDIHNISDKRYASVVKKNVGRDVSYAAGAPRSWLVSYRYQF